MFDWKEKVDKFFLDQEEKRRRAKERAEEEERKRKEQEEARRLERLSRRFKCHIRGCGYRATRPTEGYFTGGEDKWTGSYYGHYVPTNWNRPGDLYLCDKCKKWTCGSHIHRGICQECAKEL